MSAHCVLYTFVRSLSENAEKAVKVARLTDDVPDDWRDWPNRYCERHPDCRLLGIAGIDFVDDRAGERETTG